MIDAARVVPLETLRLRLRPLQSSDAEPITALLQDPVIARWTSALPWPYTVEDARAFIASQEDADRERSSFVWGIVEKATDSLAGTIGLHDVQQESRRAALGYWMGEAFRGRRYTTEAARRVLSWAFETAGFERIQATYFPGNDASAAVMRKIGLQPEGLLRGYGFKNGQPVDLYLQAVLRGDPTWLPTDEQGRDGEQSDR